MLQSLMSTFREDQNVRLNHQQARGIVIHERKLLVMFRRNNDEEYYVLPGGHLRIDESPERACVREIKEETTIKVKIEKILYEITDNTKNKPRKEYYFLCQYVSGTPTLSGEESRRNTESDYYQPQWITLESLELGVFYPLFLKEWIRENIY